MAGAISASPLLRPILTSVNATLRRFLEESGFEVIGMKGLNLIRATGAVTQDQLFDFSAGVFAAFPKS